MYKNEFSIQSVLEMERDLDKSLQEMMRVKQVGDISQSLLKQTNKDTLIKLVNLLTGTLKRSSALLGAAAADVDSLKSDHIRLQGELLSAKEDIVASKNEELNEVKKTVKSEMKSWADVVSKNVKPATEITAKVIKDAVKSAHAEEDRSRNLMVYGLKEEGVDGDTLQLDDMLKELGTPCDSVTYVRVGAVKQGSVRPVRLTFAIDEKEGVPQTLSRAKELKSSVKFSAVFLGPDRSVEERKAHRLLVEEMKRKRSENPDKVYFIKQGTVCFKARQTDDKN